MKTAEEIVSFGQGNVEALVKSSQIVATGLQDMTKMMAASAQASMDEAMSVFRAMAGVKSVKEAIELQTSLLRTSVEKTMTQSSQLAESSYKLTEQAMAPIANRMQIAVQSFKTA